jgi:quercetin dioxygenase-like cupin family protein
MEEVMKKAQAYIVLLIVSALVTFGLAQSSKEKKASPAQGEQTHVMIAANDVKWGAPPPSAPAGAQFAVLEGDPAREGSRFTVRVKMPDSYRVPPHWHPTDEHVTVLEGTLALGLGEKFDAAMGHELSAGGYFMMPKGVRHFVWAKGPTTIQVHGMGPLDINYINPADDPRQKK